MTIEAGALALRITEVGGDAVLAKLGQVDAKARALGQSAQTLHFNAPTATTVNGQLQTLGTSFTRVTTAANAATPALAQHAAAQHRVATQAGATTSSTNALTSALGRQLLVYLSFSAAKRAYDAVSDAADRQDTAQRKLSATARLTGQSLATITDISTTAEQKFRVSGSTAADLTQNFVKLASRAGDVTQTGALMSAWMDLAKAQGLSLSDVMTGINSTLVGQDEGLNRLGLANPSNIWKKWADAAGTTVAKMTEQQKWQAIVNEVTEQGAKVQGEYGRFLDTTAGKQEAFNSVLEKAYAAIGKNIEPTRQWAYSLGTTLAEAFLKFDKIFNDFDAKAKSLDNTITPSWLKRILRAVGIMSGEVVTASPLDTDANLSAAIDGMNATIDKTKPKPKPPPTAAEIAAAKEAAEAARIQRSLDRMRIAAPGVTGVIGQSQVGDLLSRIPLVGVDSKGKMKGESAFGLDDVVDADFDALEAKIRERQEQLSGIVIGVGNTIGDAMASGFRAAFSGGNFFAEMGKALLVGIGNMIVQLGSAMLTYGLLMAVGLPLLIATPFAASALSAPAAIAAGTGLIALGAGMGAIAGGGGKGGGGGSNARPAPPREQDDNQWSVAFDPDRKLRKGAAASAVAPSVRPIASGPMPEARPVVHIGVLNALHPDDPRWQREIAATYKNARDRGLIRNAG